MTSMGTQYIGPELRCPECYKLGQTRDVNQKLEDERGGKREEGEKEEEKEETN